MKKDEIVILVFLDESGDLGHPLKRKPGKKYNENTTYFVLGGIAIEENRLPILSRRLDELKKSFFGEKKFAEHHNELKTSRLLGPKWIMNDMRRKFVKALALMLRELNASLFATVFDKRKARPFIEDTDNPPPIKPWFYGLGYQKLLPAIHDFISTKEVEEHGLLVFDQHGLDKELSKQIVMYLYGNTQGREMRFLSHFALYGISDYVPGIQWADFVAGVVRYWYEYNYAEGVHSRRFSKDELQPLDETYGIIRKLMYYQKTIDENEGNIHGFVEVC
ncbi:DUF3800 domain-containing protein [bacterium]|nr:DUF3800 domain-containing protein [bacterium]